MRRGKDASLKALISAMAEAESKSYYEEQENALNDLSGLLKTFLTVSYTHLTLPTTSRV